MARYTDEEAREILRRAIESDLAQNEGLGHADLVEAARELGIEPDEVDRAALAVREETALEARRIERRRTERARFVGRAGIYVVVNAFLALLDYMTGTGWWVQWPLLIWGFFLALDAVRLVSPSSRARRDRRAEVRYRRQAERRARRRRRHEAKLRRAHAEGEFEAAVERGVAALLGAAARSLDGLVEGRRPGSDFERYVGEQKGGRSRSAPAGAGPRARVASEEPSPWEEEEPSAERADPRHRRADRS